jgi:RNA polymerase sigma-70 factor (ECF subfamily)
MATDLLTPPSATEEGAFEGFFREHFGRVYGLLYRVTGNAQDAEDLSQELFLQASRRAAEQPNAGWLWQAAAHQALNCLRGQRRRAAREDRSARQDLPAWTLSEGEQDPAASLLRREQRTAVRRALGQLPPRDAVLLLARHSGLSYAELAAALNLNPASIGTLLARAERRFKDVYQHQEETS